MFFRYTAWLFQIWRKSVEITSNNQSEFFQINPKEQLKIDKWCNMCVNAVNIKILFSVYKTLREEIFNGKLRLMMAKKFLCMKKNLINFSNFE